MDSITEYLETISHTNLLRLETNNCINKDNLWYNKVYLTNKNIPFERLIFHVGSSNQTRLIPMGLSEKMPSINLGYVFFSTIVADLKYYLEEGCSVYFADLQEITEARVQKCYKHKVLFQDDISKKIQDYEKEKCSINEVEEVINDWKIKYTNNFNPLKVKKYKKSGDYILVAPPIKVFLE